jgi:hypothetical protein
MYEPDPERLLNFLKGKKEKHAIRVTTRIKGELKNEFLSDCISRQANESKIAHSALDIYYSILRINPELKNKDFSEIKGIVTSKMRL